MRGARSARALPAALAALAFLALPAADASSASLAPVSGSSSLALAPGFVIAASYRSPADGAERGYAIRVPRGWDGMNLLPAILFLHGRGGTVRQFQRTPYFDAADARGVVLVFWEGRIALGGAEVPSTHYVDGADGVPDETDVLACLDDVLSRAPVDAERVTLAGFSQGGRGALGIGLLNPSRFAAVVDAAGPTDAFQGQLWSPAFPDYLAAAGGPPSAGGEVLARWHELSPRFLLPNARNLFVAVLHGQVDDVVPDSAAYFPYRNSHHVTVTPGFSDARGRTPTLAELHAEDEGGYAFSTDFPDDVGHDQVRLLTASALFEAALGKVRASRPERVVGVSFGARERTFHWARLGRRIPPDGTRLLVDARSDLPENRVDLRAEGPARVRLDLPAAGLDAARALSVRVDAVGAIDLALDGPFPPAVAATLDGRPVPVERTAEGVALPGLAPAAPGALLVVAPAPAGPVAEGDRLVPALVRTEGANGARYDTVVTLANLSDGPLSLEALLLDGASAPVPLLLPAGTSRAVPAGTLGAASAAFAAPLRLRVLSGEGDALAASARVFSASDDGTYGLSFPVLTAGESVLSAGETALLFGPRDPASERLNVSLFAPFEASTAEVAVFDGRGVAVRTRPVALAALARVQLDDLLRGEAPGAHVRVSVFSGRLQAYGTAVSNGPTNDPWRVPALPLAAAAKAWTVPAVASAEGRNGAYFRSDLFVFAPEGASLDATLLPRDGSPHEKAGLLVPGGAPHVVADLLASLFPSKAPGAGALLLSSTSPFLPLAVTRSEPPTGPSSQDLPCVPEGGEVVPGRPVAFAGVDESTSARSNLVLVAPATAARVRLRLLAPSGPLGEHVVDLPAGRVVQLDSVASRFTDDPVEGGTLLVSCESGAVVASVARIDAATNDPAGLAPLPVVVR
ncbi:MAG TPA: alpha/beta hydrolase-fold protein [Thermoanaerobaculia bacterium]|nr:alpha/beta hydrolase-fold protein [Thermoanaerobaculia bacterium]